MLIQEIPGPVHDTKVETKILQIIAPRNREMDTAVRTKRPQDEAKHTFSAPISVKQTTSHQTCGASRQSATASRQNEVTTTLVGQMLVTQTTNSLTCAAYQATAMMYVKQIYVVMLVMGSSGHRQWEVSRRSDIGRGQVEVKHALAATCVIRIISRRTCVAYRLRAMIYIQTCGEADLRRLVYDGRIWSTKSQAWR